MKFELYKLVCIALTTVSYKFSYVVRISFSHTYLFHLQVLGFKFKKCTIIVHFNLNPKVSDQ